jgi:ribosomal-protein-alanine N-acetyltransferase
MSSAEKLSPVVVRLSKGAAAELSEIDNECNVPPWSERLFEGEFGNPCSRVYGARISGLIVGFLVARVVEDEAHVVSLGVRRLLRSKGVARSLLISIFREFHREAVRWVVLEVRRANLVAQTLYRSLGFTETGVSRGYYVDNHEDAILMTLNISDFISRWGEDGDSIRSAA